LPTVTPVILSLYYHIFGFNAKNCGHMYGNLTQFMYWSWQNGHITCFGMSYFSVQYSVCYIQYRCFQFISVNV